MVMERIWPDQELPHSPNWWIRVILFNLAQLGVVILGGYTWDLYFHRWSLLNLSASVEHTALQGIICYIVSSFIYYWWHRFRHMSKTLWVVFHQIHHSPVRLETITAFYKHPAELVVNSILSGLIAYTLLGLSIEGAAWMTMFSALGEFFYHMNVKTPRWVGYIIQRPEMHRIHHERDKHTSNFGDLPVFDILFGTYVNPKTYEGPCGFREPRESKVLEMLLFRDVNTEISSEQP